MSRIQKLTIKVLIIILCTYNVTCWAVGPFDYRDPKLRERWLGNVERHHFNKNVEQLIGGISTSEGPYIDLAYTLRVFPNHPRALNSMARFLSNANHMALYHKTPDYYFLKAIEFAPDDATVYHLYAIHLHKKRKLKKALENYNIALQLQPSNPEIVYNLGLLYFDMKKYNLAMDYAKKAYGLGFLLPGLKNKLTELGIWED